MADEFTPAFLQRLRRLAAPEAAAVSDAELLERFVQTRDAAAFELLVWRHGPLVLGVCRRLLRQAQDAEDAFQATFLTLVRKAGSIGKRASLGNWLYRVAYRVALRARQTAASRTAREQRVARGVAVCAPEPAQTDLHAALVEEVGRLPEKYRAAVVLCYFLGKTHDEAARRLGCPRGTVAVRLLRAKERLRGRLERRGFTLGVAALVAALAEGEVMALPDALLTRTLRAALVLAAGRSLAAGGVSLKVIALMEATVQAMWWTQFKLTTGAVVALGLLGASGGWVAFRADGPEPDGPRAQRVQKPAPKDAAAAEAEKAAQHEKQLEEELLAQRAKLRQVVDERDELLARVRVAARGERIAADERVRMLEREQAAERTREQVRLQAYETRTRKAKDEVDSAQSDVQQWHRRNEKDHPQSKTAEEYLRRVEVRSAKAEAELRKYDEECRTNERSRTEALIRARQELMDLEEMLRREERKPLAERDRAQSDLDYVEARLNGLRGYVPSVHIPMNTRPASADAKLDQLLREMEELRREVREMKSQRGPREEP